MKHSIWIALIAATLGCETTSSVSERSESPSALPSGAWALEAFELSGGRMIPVADKGAYTLEFVDEERLHVRADCNVCNGGYSLASGSIEIGLLACTRAACPPESLESDYLQALDGATTVATEGASLRILYGEGALLFVRP